MNFLKEFKIIDGIYSFNITSDTTNLVKDFYFEKPFPSYSSEDDKYSILKKGNENYLSKIIKNRELEIDKNKKSYYFIFVTIFYSILMTTFSLSGAINSELIKNLIAIPITAQILHFYLDSKLWKFSESHNRSAVLHYLKK